MYTYHYNTYRCICITMLNTYICIRITMLNTSSHNAHHILQGLHIASCYPGIVGPNGSSGRRSPVHLSSGGILVSNLTH